MSYIKIPTRTTFDINAASDINQLMVNNDFLYDKIYEEIIKDIQMLKVENVLCNPLDIPSDYMIADGSVFPSGSTAELIHVSGGTLFDKIYTPTERTNIPDLLGQHIRYSDMGSGLDPDADKRRQLTTGLVDTSAGNLYLSPYHINLIKEAFDAGREIQIGELNTDLWTGFTVRGTVASVNTTSNYITLTDIIGTWTDGSKSLVLKGDLVGSFQKDIAIEHRHYQYVDTNASGSGINLYSGGDETPASYSSEGNNVEYRIRYSDVTATKDLDANTGMTGLQDSGGDETRPANIALLPLVRIHYEDLT